jgi:RNA polymerase sigma factor (sigma-70 family)
MPTSGLREQLSDADLWRSVCEEDALAFEAVVVRYQSLICAVAYSACGNLTSSEDVAQEVFWSAWRERESLADHARLKAWLCGIARNLGHNVRRRLMRTAQTASLHTAMNVPTGEQTPSEVAVSREEQILVWQVLERIPRSYREPLVLFYRADQSISEIAEALDVSPDAVKQRLSRGRSMVKDGVLQLLQEALRRGRPGRNFTVAVMAGLATVSAGAKSALAGITTAAPLAKVAATVVPSGFWGAASGAAGGLLGTWFGAWVPAQLAPTVQEREYVWRGGKRVFVVSLLFVGILAGAYLVFPRQLTSWTDLCFLAIWIVTLWLYVHIEVVRLTHGVKRLRAAATALEPNDSPLRARLIALTFRYRGRVFRSQTMLCGLPLLVFNVTDPAQADEATEHRVARGWIAIGDEAYGVLFALGGRAYGFIAVGGRAYGFIAVGGRAYGFIAVGGSALGVFAIGGTAMGVLACGGLGIGWQAIGGLALAWNLACGAQAIAWQTAYGVVAIAHHAAIGQEAWAQHTNDPVATAIVSSSPVFSAVEWCITNWVLLTPIFVVGIALLCAGTWSLLYRRETSR